MMPQEDLRLRKARYKDVFNDACPKQCCVHNPETRLSDKYASTQDTDSRVSVMFRQSKSRGGDWIVQASS